MLIKEIVLICLRKSDLFFSELSAESETVWQLCHGG